MMSKMAVSVTRLGCRGLTNALRRESSHRSKLRIHQIASSHLKPIRFRSTVSAASSSSSSSSTAAPLSSTIFGPHDIFAPRHLGPSSKEDVDKMLAVIGYDSLDALIDATVPAHIRSKEPLKLPAAQGELEALKDFVDLMEANELYRSYIGQGYYDTITPPVILRNIIENPAWYTPYTPYQAEIAQGRLEMLLNFQTMVSDLTGLPVANSSLLDEGTAAAEAMNMCYNASTKKKKTFLVSQDVHPQTIAVIKTRAKGADIQIKIQKDHEMDLSNGQQKNHIYTSVLSC